jgi:hypothetical protein
MLAKTVTSPTLVLTPSRPGYIRAEATIKVAP